MDEFIKTTNTIEGFDSYSDDELRSLLIGDFGAVWADVSPAWQCPLLGCDLNRSMQHRR